LGGHSLLATQFISRIRDTFDLELPLRAIFEHPTIADLAIALEEAKARGERPEAPPMVPLSREKYRVKRSTLSSGDGDEPEDKSPITTVSHSEDS